MFLSLDRMDSPIGTILLVTDTDGIVRALDFADHETRMQTLLSRHYKNLRLTDGAAPTEVCSAMEAYFAGELSAIEKVTTATNGTEFQREVWAALGTIPTGTTISYGQLADRLGRAGASRAVGLANGANPIAIIVPCHRVIGSNGKLTGYGGGLDRKRWLLEHEGNFKTGDT